MKQFLCLIATLIIVNPIFSDEEQREAKPRFKGVELYSWKDKDGNWVFALLDGTNRQKNEKEIKESKQLKGVEELKKALTKLSKGEQLSWGNHQIKDAFEFPSEEVCKEIQKVAKDAEIKLYLVD